MAATYTHKQRVAIKRIRLGVMSDGRKVFFDDWSEQGTIRATKRDERPLGYWVVRFDTGGDLCIHEDQMRAA